MEAVPSGRGTVRASRSSASMASCRRSASRVRLASPVSGSCSASSASRSSFSFCSVTSCMATTAPSMDPSSSTSGCPLRLTLRFRPDRDSSTSSTSQSCSPDMARMSGFSRGDMGEPSPRRRPWSLGMLPMGSAPSSSPWSLLADGLKTVIRPSESQATMPSSRVSNRTWRKRSSRWSSAADWRTTVMSLNEDTAPTTPPASTMACELARIHTGSPPRLRSPRTSPTERRPPRRATKVGWSRSVSGRPSRSTRLRPRASPHVSTSARGWPRIRIRGASNMTSNASLTRMTVPAASTIMTPSANDSMMVAWRRSDSRTFCSSRFCAVMSLMLTTIPPIGSSRWFTATTSRSMGVPSARRVLSSRETESLRRATRSANRPRTESMLNGSKRARASWPSTSLTS